MSAMLLLSFCLAADSSAPTLDFETGTLTGWTAEGEAFQGQPIRGDTVARRRKDMASHHQGDWWIGTYEIHGDKPKGTLTSAPFTVTHPWASFLVGGGSGPQTRVEVLHDGRVIFKAHGRDHEALERVAVDLAKYQGQAIQIRLVDQASGGWGHINFDDFRFHAEKPVVPVRTVGAATEHAGLTPEKAAAAMSVPEGFHVTLVAGEPDLHQPIQFCFDDRGRLWVVEAFTYPRRDPHPGPIIPDKSKGDKVVILEDVDGDGKHDKRTVVIEGLNLVSGIEYGFGGIFIGAAPYLLHIPIKDDKPAGEPKILLDGWGYQDTHETLNSFIWGPDGWLYGCHGVFTHSRVGKPGTPDPHRIPINAGVWRYHPTRHVFEVFAHGTSNPWGIDFNPVGDFFVEACVIPHLFHITQNGRYTRQAGEHFNKHTDIEIPTIADHLHYSGNQWNNDDRAKSADLGGGHAHCGLLCYQGGAWPREFHGQLFMGNIHGKRINVDILHPKGGTYVGTHGKDFLLANDAWARFTAIKSGPDGNVFVSDWYDKQACHRTEPEVWDRTNGRIYKISYRGTTPVTAIDLAKCSDAELIRYQSHANEWYVRTARRILQERAAAGQNSPTQRLVDEAASEKVIRDERDITKKLRLLWLRHVCGLAHDQNARNLVKNESATHFRGWVIALAAQSHLAQSPADDPRPSTSDAITEAIQACDPHNQQTPLALPDIARIAAILPNLPPRQRERALRALLRCTQSVEYDHATRCLIWYALESLAEHDGAIDLMRECISHGRREEASLLLKRLMARRSAQIYQTLINTLNPGETDVLQRHLIAFEGELRRRADPQFKPAWETIRKQCHDHGDPAIRRSARTIDALLGDADAIESVRTICFNPRADFNERREALRLLIDIRDQAAASRLGELLGSDPLRPMAIVAMSSMGGTESAQLLVRHYASFSGKEKRDAIATLASKPASARALLDAVEAKTIPAADVTAETIRQLRAFKDTTISNKVVALWGIHRDSPAEKKKLITEWRRKLTLTHQDDHAAGRAVFAKVCQQCHTLYGIGSTVGPDITGSNRADLDYLLENIFDPNAVIPKEYAATTFDLADGRKITGIVKQDGPEIAVQTATELVRFAAEDVEKRSPSNLSMMPDDLTRQLSDDEVKNLIAYLRLPRQVPMKATPENSGDFFNGKDLTHWDGDTTIWSVDKGEIVGRTATGLKRNTFLKSHFEVRDFRLTLKVKLTPNRENSGIQFRSEPIEGGEMRGPQADIGAGWWGKLYEESGRGLLVKDGGEKHVKADDWNDYVIEARGPAVKLWLNGQLVADYADDKIARQGVIALQVHSGGPMEVRFRDLKLEVIASSP